MMNDCIAGWFMVDEPHLPVLLYTRRLSDEEKRGATLDIISTVYEQSKKIAEKHGIYRSVHVGTYFAYLSILTGCLMDSSSK
jgi:hypothetical protein